MRHEGSYQMITIDSCLFCVSIFIPGGRRRQSAGGEQRAANGRVSREICFSTVRKTREDMQTKPSRREGDRDPTTL